MPRSDSLRAGRMMQLIGEQRRARLAMRAPVALLVLAAALASIPGCSGGGGSVPAQTINVTEADNLHAVTMASGDTLVVSLKSTPGAGFIWRVAQLDDKVLRQAGEPRVIPAPNPMPGAPATQVFRFVATGGGSTGLELDYVRPWEKGQPPARTFNLGVTVR
jgi:predicted secreted protein